MSARSMKEAVMLKKILKRNVNSWCCLEVELDNGSLSICGAEGYITSLERARE